MRGECSDCKGTAAIFVGILYWTSSISQVFWRQALSSLQIRAFARQTTSTVLEAELPFPERDSKT